MPRTEIRGGQIKDDSIDLLTDCDGTLPIANGGTGQTTANAALNALLPPQAGHAGKVLKTDGSNTSWQVDNVGSGGTANIKQIEVNFGDVPVAEAEFTITDTDVTTSSQILAQVAYEAPTGKELDELEMDDLVIKCQPLNGEFKMLIRAIDGSYLHDNFLINYLVG